MNIDDDFCPNCGCKSLHKETKINYKKILVVGGIVIIISAAVFGCVKHFNGKHDVKENYPQAYADLKQTLTDGLELVDDCSQLVERTWHYAEAQQFNEDTYEYSVSEDGEFFSSKKALKKYIR